MIVPVYQVNQFFVPGLLHIEDVEKIVIFNYVSFNKPTGQIRMDFAGAGDDIGMPGYRPGMHLFFADSVEKTVRLWPIPW